MERIAYDEFGLFHENADEFGLPYDGPPDAYGASRGPVDGGRRLSALVWGTPTPELVFLHGGAQNAHTWDTVALALGPAAGRHRPARPRPLRLARRDGVARPPSNMADDVAVVVRAARAGRPGAWSACRSAGMTTDRAGRPRTRARAASGARRHHARREPRRRRKAITDFVNGPPSFPTSTTSSPGPSSTTRRAPASRCGAASCTTPTSSTTAAGSGTTTAAAIAAASDSRPDRTPVAARVSPLWDDFGEIACPLLLARGGVSPVVDDDDVAEARRRQPAIEVEVVDGAGHSIQGDRPLELAAIIRRFAPLGRLTRAGVAQPSADLPAGELLSMPVEDAVAEGRRSSRTRCPACSVSVDRRCA